MSISDHWCVERSAGYAYGIDYRNQINLSATYLESLPTIAHGQSSDLKIEYQRKRVWLSRCTTIDGEPYNHKVTIEVMDPDGNWHDIESYPAACPRCDGISSNTLCLAWERSNPAHEERWYLSFNIPDLGIVYVRRHIASDGSWYTTNSAGKRTWKTRRGAVAWALARPEMVRYCTIHQV